MSGIRGERYIDENGNLVLTGGLKAAETNRKKQGEDFYQRIGRIGGRNGNTGGFHANPELARLAGRKGGRISRRGPVTKPRKDKGAPRKEYNADTNFVEHVETKKPEVKKRIWKWPWSK